MQTMQTMQHTQDSILSYHFRNNQETGRPRRQLETQWIFHCIPLYQCGPVYLTPVTEFMVSSSPRCHDTRVSVTMSRVTRDDTTPGPDNPRYRGQQRARHKQWGTNKKVSLYLRLVDLKHINKRRICKCRMAGHLLLIFLNVKRTADSTFFLDFWT